MSDICTEFERVEPVERRSRNGDRVKHDHYRLIDKEDPALKVDVFWSYGWSWRTQGRIFTMGGRAKRKRAAMWEGLKTLRSLKERMVGMSDRREHRTT